MIVDELIRVKVPHKTVKYYNTIGYKCSVNEFIFIKPNELPKGSMIKINAKCTNCKSINNISYNNYINKQIIKYGFYVCKHCSSIKSKKTILERYGVEYYSQLSTFKDIIHKTSQKKWGVNNYTQTEEYKIKSNTTCLERWGTKHPSQCDAIKSKTKKTILERYGVDNIVLIHGNNIAKRCKTNLVKYGFEHAIQNESIFLKNFRKRKHIYDTYYDSLYELDFIHYCANNSIELKRMSTVRYELDDKKRIYYPDFYLPKYNLICEVKSTYTYNYNTEMNEAKKKACIDSGYNFIFIIDKKLDELKNKLK